MRSKFDLSYDEKGPLADFCLHIATGYPLTEYHAIEHMTSMYSNGY